MSVERLDLSADEAEESGDAVSVALIIEMVGDDC